MAPIKYYMESGKLPNDKREAENLKTKAP